MRDLQLSREDRLVIAKTFWNVAYSSAINACKEDGIESDVIVEAMCDTMVAVIRTLLKKEGEF